MTAHEWSIVASVLGFVGGLLLFYPGWRVSQSLKIIERLRSVVEAPADNNDKSEPPAPMKTGKDPAAAVNDVDEGQESENDDESDNDPGEELVDILEENHVAWRPLEHRLLIGGIVLIILSFGTDLFVKLNQPPT